MYGVSRTAWALPRLTPNAATTSPAPGPRVVPNGAQTTVPTKKPHLTSLPIYLYIYLKRSYFWGFSFGDTVIFPKLGENISFALFTRLRSRKVVLYLVMVYVRSFLPSYNCRYLTYFDQTWNTERGKYGEGSTLYFFSNNKIYSFLSHLYVE